MRALLDSWSVSVWAAAVFVLIGLWQVRLLLVLDQNPDTGWSASITLGIAIIGLLVALGNIYRVLWRS